MKIRIGFVSNSSSASFVVHWRARSRGEGVDLVHALINLFGIYFPDGEAFNAEGRIDWDKVSTYDQWTKDIVEAIIEDTDVNTDGTFSTSFFTGMLNTAEDFGETAKSLVFALTVHDNEFEMIDTFVDSDNG